MLQKINYLVITSLILFFNVVSLIAQETKHDVNIDINSNSPWYSQWWLWGVIGILFIITIISLVSRGGGTRRA